MNQILKNIGGFALGVVGFAAIIVVVFLLVQGGTWLADKVYPILIVLFVLALAVTVVVLLPLAIFRKTRGFAAAGIYVTSYVYGLTVWVWSLLLTYTLWGGFGVVIGILMGGVGIVPLSVVACLFKGLFSIAFQVVLLAAFVFGVRAFALFLAASAERYQEV
ncbi:MAG: hypothetical protein DLM73_03045 [Chthoniobacterales bacterium]|nr:MAG: hypothetical protein DLM73_03045 [Chthoniobacterales bacterium]